MKFFITILLAFFSTIAIAASQNDLGGMDPQKALDYMEKTKNLVIVDVASKGWYAKKHFDNAVNIPIEDISDDAARQMYMELPSGKPVILHCRRGMIVPGAYRELKKLRPDIPEISYIDGKPMFDEYNKWNSKHKK